MLKKILKFFLVLIILVAAAIFTWWLIVVKGYSLWVILAVLMGLVGLWLAYIFIKKYFLRRREKEFVQRVITQDEEAIKRALPEEQKELKDLQESWKESIELLCSSHLRKRGNPLYVLPWYLVIGESGSGKTSAVKNTNLSSSIAEVHRKAEIAVTRNCDWWFFDKAIILDTAGRYTIPVEEGRDKEEWKTFLTLLAKYRRREPLNGVIVTIAADKLLELDEAGLSDEGQSVRKRVDQLMRILGAKFPVYILVTKLDLVKGMVEFNDLLPKSGMDQAMGLLNRRLDSDWKDVLNRTMGNVTDKLKNLQRILIHKERMPEPEVFLFINEFERLRYGLEIFLHGVFDENPYQVTPLLRGLFFSSAIQEGRHGAETSKTFGLKKDDIEQIVQNNGLYLKDIFKNILPSDRNLFSPLKEFMLWRRLTQDLGLLSWTVLWLCLCVFATFSYIVNRNALSVVTADWYKPPAITDSLSVNLSSLVQMRSRVVDLWQANRKWYVPWLGFKESMEAETVLKTRYLQLVRYGLLDPTDKTLAGTMAGSAVGEESTLDLIEYLEARIRLIQEYKDNKSPATLPRFQELSGQLLPDMYQGLTPEDATYFALIYSDYLLWSNDRSVLEEEQKKFQLFLNRLLDKNENLSWIINTGIINESPIRLEDFWSNLGDDSFTEEIYVPGAFTDNGRKQLEAFFSSIESVLQDTSRIRPRKREFQKWYQLELYRAWGRFAGSFDKGMIAQRDAGSWRQSASLMTTDYNPYFLLLERMAEEFSKMPRVSEEPPWVKAMLQLHDTREQMKLEREKKGRTLVGEIAAKKDEIIEGALRRADKKKLRELEFKISAARALDEYEQALSDLSPSLSNREACFQAVRDFLTTAQSKTQSQSTLYNAELKLSKFKKMFKDIQDVPYLWDLLSGPQRIIRTFTGREAACVIQEQWEEEVLGGIAWADQDKLLELLFAKNEGLVWKFINSTGKPFIARDRYGYIPRERTEKLFEFDGVFFEFLNIGAENLGKKQPEYIITLETLPLEVNSGANLEPYGCVLSLQSPDGTLSLENYNYPQKRTIYWSPEKFGDVTLNILFPKGNRLPEIVLSKSYKGNMAFAELLSEFAKGSRTFRISEFSREEKSLKDLGIEWIRVSYKISGGEAVIQLLNRAPFEVPAEIIVCWPI